MKRLLSIATLLLFAVLLVSCDDSKTSRYTVTFDTAGGSAVEAKEVEDGSLVERPTDPTKKGFDFDGWFKDDNYNVEWIFQTDIVDKNITLYAKWKDVDGEATEKVTVTFNFNYTGANRPTEVKVDKGEKLGKTDTPEIPTRDNFEFLGWSTKQNELDEFDLDEVINDDITLFAIWKTTLEEVTITFKVDGEDDVHETIVKGEKLDVLDVPEPTKDGHTFLGWFDNDNKEWNFSVEDINNDLVVTAKFQKLDRDGTPITTTNELVELMTSSHTDSNEVFYLTKDIDMTDIVVEYDNGAKFTGTFDGQGFTIKNLTYHSSESNAKLGLFKTINDAKIINLKIDNADIKSENERAGILAGEVDGGENSVQNVHITNSKVYGNQGNNSAGGLFAYVKAPLDVNNVSLDNVEIEGERQGVGGLIGRINVSVELNITNIFVNADIKGMNRIGGLIGDSSKINQTTIDNVVVIANITGTTTHSSALLGKGDSSNNATDELPGITVNNFVSAVTIDGFTGNVGYLSGDNNKMTTSNVYTYHEGVKITHSSAGTNEVLTNIHNIFDKDFWTTNLANVTESDLWKETEAGIYVLKDSNLSVNVPTHVLVTFDLGYDDKEVLVYSVLPGTKAPLFTPNRDDYDFDGWYLNDIKFDNSNIEEAITLVAKWSETVYTNVTFKVEDQEYLLYEDVAVGSLLEKPVDPTKNEYDFVGWYDETDNKWDFSNDLVVDSLVLTAKFKPIQYGEVKFIIADEEVEVLSVVIGTKIEEPDTPTKDGHIFLGWYDEEDNKWDFDKVLEAPELKLEAKFIDDSQLDELEYVYYFGNENNDTDFFDDNASGTIDGMDAYNFNGVLIDKPLKFDSNAEIKFTTTQPLMTLEMVVRTRKDESDGRIKVNDDIYNLLKDDFTTIKVTLTEADTYVVKRDNRELGVYYIRVYYEEEEVV